MSSSAPNDTEKKERRLSGEQKDDVGLNGDLLADTMDLKTSEAMKSPSLTVDDIVDANAEGFVETDQIRKLDKHHMRSESKRRESWLLPSIPDVFLENLENIENEQDDNFETGDGEQEMKVETGNIQNPERQSVATAPTLRTSVTSPTTLSDLTKKLEAPLQQEEVSRQSITMDDPVVNVTDLYYQNAAKIINEDDDIESGRGGSDDMSGASGSARRKKFFDTSRVKQKAAANLEVFKEFVQPHKKRFRKTFKNILIYIMLPSLFMSIILFYALDNPPTGYALMLCRNQSLSTTSSRRLEEAAETQGLGNRLTLSGTLGQIRQPFKGGIGTPLQKQTSKPKATQAPAATPTSPAADSDEPDGKPKTLSQAIDSVKNPDVDKDRQYMLSDRKDYKLCIDKVLSKEEASISWWFLFIGIRQAFTFFLALVLELIVIDFLVFRTKLFPKLLGTKLALAVGQSKGWPSILFFWAIIDMVLLYGSSPIARHWIFYQNWFALLNATNPSGGIPGHSRYKSVIHFAIGLSVATTLKRTIMANFLGKRGVGKFVIKQISTFFYKHFCCSFLPKYSLLPIHLNSELQPRSHETRQEALTSRRYCKTCKS